MKNLNSKNRLVFDRHSIVELNHSELNSVVGGNNPTTAPCAVTAISVAAGEYAFEMSAALGGMFSRAMTW